MDPETSFRNDLRCCKDEFGFLCSALFENQYAHLTLVRCKSVLSSNLYKYNQDDIDLEL
jgi:hypothetical protein